MSSLTLGREGAERVAYVGALQGLNSPCALHIYRSLTHRMHGLRPRDLLLTLFRRWCMALGIGRVLAVSDQNRISSHRYFVSSSQVFSSYDEAWRENGGVATEAGFFELDTRVPQRSAEDIPSRKRAQYRRRYALLDELSGQIAHRVAELHRAQQAGPTPAPTAR